MIPYVERARRPINGGREMRVEVDIPTANGRGTRRVVVDVHIPNQRLVTNEVGLQLTSRGTWESPFMEVNDRWVRRSTPKSGTWVTEPAPDEVLLHPLNKKLKRLEDHRSLVARARSEGFDHFDRDDIVVQVVHPPMLIEQHQDEPVAVQVRAFRVETGDELDVDDGVIIFDGIPLTTQAGVVDPLERLREDIRDVVQARNGKYVSQSTSDVEVD